jgi:argininosuccinate lyase
MATLLCQVSNEVTGKEIVYTDAQLAELLSPRHFVDVRKTYGGPSPSETARAMGVSKELLGRDEQWVADARGKLSRAETQLKDAANSL